MSDCHPAGFSANKNAVSICSANILIAGNPNSGKTTLFNRLTNFNQKVANYPGVTVEHVTAKFKYDKQQDVVDLPGLYSLRSEPEDAKIAKKFIFRNR